MFLAKKEDVGSYVQSEIYNLMMYIETNLAANLSEIQLSRFATCLLFHGYNSNSKKLWKTGIDHIKRNVTIPNFRKLYIKYQGS